MTDRGLAQADALVETLADDDIAVVWSSPTVHWQQTVEPLAVERGVSVRVSTTAES
jgi:broad specificity phosphatase PhoE